MLDLNSRCDKTFVSSIFFFTWLQVFPLFINTHKYRHECYVKKWNDFLCYYEYYKEACFEKDVFKPYSIFSDMIKIMNNHVLIIFAQDYKS